MNPIEKIRNNWRISLLVVLIALACFFLFVPGASLGDSLGESDNATERGMTNLQYGIDLSGGARIQAPIIGTTAENVDVERGASRQVTRDVAAALDVQERDVTTRLGETNTVEVFDDNVTDEQFESALREAGVYNDEVVIRDGVTAQTRQEMVDGIDSRMGESGFEGGTVQQIQRADGQSYIRVESPNRGLAELREMISEQGRVEVVAHYPTEGENGTVVYENETALRQWEGDIADYGSVQYDERRGSYVIDIVVSEERAPEFQQLMRDSGIASNPGQCGYPNSDQNGGFGYCQLIVHDGEVVSGLSMGQDLATPMQQGEWVTDRQFQIVTPDESSAQDIHLSLSAGSLPTELDLESSTEQQVSPTIGEQFRTQSLIAGVLAVLTVVGMVFLRYGDPRVAAPMSLTALSEVVLLLGFAAAIKWPLELAHIAGFIAVVGTGVDDLVIIADEVMSEGEVSSRKVFDSRFTKAFWVIGAAAGTTIIAMSPLAVLSLGELRGFAFVTILGVLIGVFVTRPAYGNILRAIKTDK